MGRRLVSFFLLSLALQCVANVPLHAQDSKENEAKAPAETPSMRGVETPESGSQAVQDSNTPTSDVKSISLLKEKKPKSFYEEFFGNPINYLLVLVVCVYIYLMFLQPKAGRKEQKEQLERIKNLKKNDRVVTSSGIHGIVSNINSEAGTITLRVDENSNAKLTIERNSIRSVLN